MMNKRGIVWLAVTLLMAACAQLPPKPQDIQGWKFEPVPDKAVIYIVRGAVDAPIVAPLSIGNAGLIATHAGTFFRWEVAPGVQRIETFGASMSSVTVQAQAGQIYFVEHVVSGNSRLGLASALLRRVDETRGRRLVLHAQHI